MTIETEGRARTMLEDLQHREVAIGGDTQSDWVWDGLCTMCDDPVDWRGDPPETKEDALCDGCVRLVLDLAVSELVTTRENLASEQTRTQATAGQAKQWAEDLAQAQAENLKLRLGADAMLRAENAAMRGALDALAARGCCCIVGPADAPLCAPCAARQAVASTPPTPEPKDELRSAVLAYIEHWSLEHEDPDCPADDTCSCPLVRDVEKALHRPGCAIRANGRSCTEGCNRR